MRKLAFAALLVGLVACSKSNGATKIILVDAPSGDGGGALCNVLTQTGCASGEKCSWIEDSMTLGHVGCAPMGTVALNGACAYGAPGATGYDNCVGGTVCLSDVCKQIVCHSAPRLCGCP